MTENNSRKTNDCVDDQDDDGNDKINHLCLLENSKKLVAAFADMKGKRWSMEDSHINSRYNDNVRIFGVCDGHGGSTCSEFLQKNLCKHIFATLNATVNVRNASLMKILLCIAFQKCETEFELLHKNDTSGSTCCILIYFERLNLYYVANCGDSRAIFCSNVYDFTSANVITTDHKPNLASEKFRIESLGGFVSDFAYMKFGRQEHVYRVQGVLSVSRSFGDQQLRPYIKETPDVFGPFTSTKNSCVLIACDGAFENNTTEELSENISLVVKLCAEEELRLSNSKKCEISYEAARSLTIVSQVLNFAYKKGSEDNISAIFLQFL